MAEPTLEERLANYGTSLDEARRLGVVREGRSWARRLVPAAAFVTAFAAVIAAVVLIPRDDDAPDRMRPADLAAAEAEIRDAFATWLDENATQDARDAARERLEDPQAQARADQNWDLMQQTFLGAEAVVVRIEFVESTRAFVDYRLSDSQGSSITQSTPGEAVLLDGRWRVSYAGACALGTTFGATCEPDDFLTEEQQAIGQPFVNIAWSELPDEQRVRDIEGGGEIRDQILDAVNRHRTMLSAKTQLLAVRHRPGEKTAKIWWTVGTVQPGIAVLDGDHWTVSRETWCGLTRNAGEYPPACGESAPTTSTIAPLPTTLDIELGTKRLWPADGRSSDSSADPEEAARRFFAALDLPDVVITAPEEASGPTWVRTEIEGISVPVLLVPADGVWVVHTVDSGVMNDSWRHPDTDVADWEVTWIDEGGVHRERARGRDFDLPGMPATSALGVAKDPSGRVVRVSGGVYDDVGRPRPTSAPPCGASDLVVSGGNSTNNHVGDGDAIFLSLENHSRLACRASILPEIELHSVAGWTRFTARQAQAPNWDDEGIELVSDGLFTPDLVGEVFIGGRQGDAVVEYDSVRLVLPTQERLELALHLRTAGTELDVSPYLLHVPHV
jgi:hypothetical protein